MAEYLNPPVGVRNITATPPRDGRNGGSSGPHEAVLGNRARAVPDSDRPDGVLFDMDGTLIDSEPLWMAAETELVSRYGGVWTHDDALGLVGNSLPKSAKIMREKAKLPLSDDEILHYLLSSVTAAAEATMPWRPGAVRLLTALKAAAVPCALVTASYRSFADVVMRAANGALTAVVPGDEVVHGKPDPESYLTAAAKIDIPVTKCVAIEDSVPGVASALASGAHTIGIPSVVPLAAQPGLSRFHSLADLDLETLARIANGQVIDRLQTAVSGS